MAIGLLELLGVISIESLMLRLVRLLKGVTAEPCDGPESVFNTQDRLTIELLGIPGVLTDKEAHKLIEAGIDPLDLSFVHSMTVAAADVLAKHKGTLMLNGLREVSTDLAKSLRWHKGRLELNGVAKLTVAAAAHVARHEGDLALSGIRSLPSKLARQLAHHKGTLELRGVRMMDEAAAAEWIVKHRGPVHFGDSSSGS